ncbi:hypothetical protein HRI_004268200 [Hibiscus trionum]|uniref:Uncharacterized protein n=1 Tax=Hibiscus trionum TaxID=183268 RepID=A0A9W7J0P2_HIBTR|nr:hypothetical protein HRI_004268200 [Hibiscus trionum]
MGCFKSFTGSSNLMGLGFWEIMFLKKGDDPGYQHLFSIAKDCMEVVCVSKGMPVKTGSTCIGPKLCCM